MAMDGRVHRPTYTQRYSARRELLPAAGLDLVFSAGLQAKRAWEIADDVSEHGSFGRGGVPACRRRALIMVGETSDTRESSDCELWLSVEYRRRPKQAD